MFSFKTRDQAFSVPDYLTVRNTIIDRQEICKNSEEWRNYACLRILYFISA